MRKSLMSKVPLVLATVFCAFGLQACFADSNNSICRTEYSCGMVCSESCTPMTDGWLVWDDCWEDCSDVCHAYEVCESVPECYYDHDCRSGEVCLSGECRRGNGGHGGQNGYYGTANLCDRCESNADCRENGALCLVLDSGEQVCGRSCVKDAECPSGYYCDAYMNGTQSVGQCAPAVGSCVNNYCRTLDDCSENAGCVDNRCVLSNFNLNECNDYNDCKLYTAGDGTPLNTCIKYTDPKGHAASYCTIDCYIDEHCDVGYTCYLEKNDLDSGICFRGTEHGCTYDRDCDGSMVCRNGKCSVACNRDADCVSRSSNLTFACVDNACKLMY